MMEEEWRSTNDTSAMLDRLRGIASDRKLRLLACAICRAVWTKANYERSRQAVQVAELYADGLAEEHELNRAWSLASAAAHNHFQLITRGKLVHRLRRTDEEIRTSMFAEAAHVHTPFLIGRLQKFRQFGDLIEYGPELLRDIFGNPFRPVTFDPRWRTSDVVDVARGIYEDKAFERMPILADALMDAGCEDEQLIGHCRGDGTHVRGCWVVDLVLGKE